MNISDFIASSGGAPDNNPEDFDIFYAASLASKSGRAKGHFVSAFEDNIYIGVFLPNDASFINLARLIGYPGLDEQGAMNFILRLHQPELNQSLNRQPNFTFLDEILSVHWFQTLSEEIQPIPFEDLQAAGSFTTLNGLSMEITGNMLVDGAPDVENPAVIIPIDINVSNGLAKAISGVLLPSSLPEPSTIGVDSVLLGTDARDRLIGGDGDDLLMDGAGRDLLLGGGGKDTFWLAGDGARDKILDFELGQDLVDLTHWDIRYMAELFVKQRNESSLLISDGRNSVVLQAADGQISVENLGSDSFIFGTDQGGTRIYGSAGRDRLQGTNGNDWIDGGLGRDFLTGGLGADLFFAGTDTFDVITDFTEGLDLIVLEDWGVKDFSELSISELRPWLLQVTSGDFALRVRAADRDIEPEDMSAEDFILFW